jgi:hypothetical protein
VAKTLKYYSTFKILLGETMNTKVLVGGSITAVILIVLASFTSVVGYTSVNDTEVVDSPLFSIRSQRALDVNGQDVIECDYVGKDKDIFIPFQKRDTKTVVVQKVIEVIYRMNDETFDNFKIHLIQHLSNNDKFKFLDSQDIIHSLEMLRENPDKINNYVADGENKRLVTEGCSQPTFESTQDCRLLWLLLCLAIFIVAIYYTILILLGTLLSIFTIKYCF